MRASEERELIVFALKRAAADAPVEMSWRFNELIEKHDAVLSDPSVDTVGKSARGQSATAKAAALKAFPGTGTQRGLILDGIAVAGSHGMIDEEMTRLPGVRDTA